MPEDTKPAEDPRARRAPAEPKGLRAGSDKDHPIDYADWKQRRAAGRLDPAGTWVQEVKKDPKTSLEVKTVRLLPTPRPGSVNDCPMSFEEWLDAIAADKLHSTAYVRFPHGNVQLMDAPAPRPRAR